MSDTQEPAVPSPEAIPDALRLALAHTFSRPELLTEALTHRSYVHEYPGPGVTSNERLEFLGDAVLALVSADLLFALSPEADEGELTLARAVLVRTSTLAEFARHVDVGPRLRLGRGEEVTGGRERDLLLASAFEAVVGALYLDGGLPAVHMFVDPLLRPAAERTLTQRREKDPKSLLQELAQGRLGTTPTYRVASAEGPAHDPHFVIEVLVGERVIGSGEGRNKRQAEQAAAERALQDPGWQVDDDLRGR